MISCLKNEQGLIYAYIEWSIVNDKGQPQDNGFYVYIDDLWVHENWRKGFGRWGVINDLIPLIVKHPFSCRAIYVYWNNEKKKFKQSRTFIIRRILKRGKRHDKKIIRRSFSMQV